MNILIISPFAGGHNISLYARLILEHAKINGYQTSFLTTREVSEHPSFKIINQIDPSINIFYMRDIKLFSGNTALILFLNQILIYFNIKDSYKKHFHKNSEVYDHIFLPNIDYCDKAIAIFGSPFRNVQFSGIHMSISIHRPFYGFVKKIRFQWLQEKLFKMLVRTKTLVQLGIMDFSFISFIKKTNFLKDNKITYVPDIGEVSGVETKSQSRKIIGLPSESFVILIYGSITERKGIKELIDAAKDIPNVTILIAGKIHHTLESYFSALNSDNNMIILNRFINLHDEYLCFKSSDIVWNCYQDNFTGSSGVLYQAASLGKPVIVNDRGLLKWIVEKNQNGFICNINDREAIKKKLEFIINNPSMISKARTFSYSLAKNHTFKRFQDAMFSNLSDHN